MAATPEHAEASSTPPEDTKSPEEIADATKNRAPPADWTQSNEEVLIEEWGSEFVRLKQGNLSARHWKRIAEAVNEKRGDCPEYTTKHCQNKIDGLKKQYKKELKNKTSTGSVNSKWVHFSKMGEFLEKLPKTIGIPNARDSSGVIVQPLVESGEPSGADPDGSAHPDFPSQVHLQDEHAGTSANVVTPEKRSASKKEKIQESTPNMKVEKGFSGKGSGGKGSTNLSPASELLAKHEKPGVVNGQRVRMDKRKRESDETMKPVAAAMDRFGAVYAQVATSMMQIQKDIALDKANRAKEMADERARREKEMADEKAKRDREIADNKAANALALKEMEMRLMMAWKGNQGQNQGPNQ